MICSLVISTFRQTDELIWIGTPKGEFSIRSTYHLEKTYFVQVAGESTTTDVHRLVWKTIWKLNVSCTVRVFL